MKKSSRFFALFLAMLMSVSLVVLSSCGGKKGGEGTGSGTGTGTGTSTHGQPVFDYGGKTVMAACFYNGIVNKTGTSTSEAGIRTLQHRKYIEELYNCKFDQITVTSGLEKEIQASHMANQVYADVFILFATNINSMRDQGMIAPIGDYYNLENPNTNFNWNIMDGGKKQGKYYYIFCGSPNVSVTTFKPDYLETYGIEDPYTLYDQGQWTTDKYLEIVTNITRMGSASGVYGVDRLTADPNLSQLLAMFGTEWVSKDEDGYFVSNLDDTRLLEALNYAVALNAQAPAAGATDVVTVFKTIVPNSGMQPLSTLDPNLKNKYYAIYYPLSEYVSSPFDANVVYQANVTAMQSVMPEETRKQVGAIWQSYTTYEGEWATPQEEAQRLHRADWAQRMYNDRGVDIILSLQKDGPTMHNASLAGNLHVDKDLYNAGKQILAGETTPASAIASVKSYVELRIQQKNKELDK